MHRIADIYRMNITTIGCIQHYMFSPWPLTCTKFTYGRVQSNINWNHMHTPIYYTLWTNHSCIFKVITAVDIKFNKWVARATEKGFLIPTTAHISQPDWSSSRTKDAIVVHTSECYCICKLCKRNKFTLSPISNLYSSFATMGERLESNEQDNVWKKFCEVVVKLSCTLVKKCGSWIDSRFQLLAATILTVYLHVEYHCEK